MHRVLDRKRDTNLQQRQQQCSHRLWTLNVGLHWLLAGSTTTGPGVACVRARRSARSWASLVVTLCPVSWQHSHPHRSAAVSGSPADTFEGTTPVMLAPVLVLAPVLSSVLGGCSFKDHLDPTFSKIHDLDQAKYAAKMALAHQGLDIETLKKRQARYDLMTFFTSFTINKKLY